MKHTHAKALAGVTLLLCGCAATGPAFSPAQVTTADKALIYIYRPEAGTLGARDAYFYVDGKNVADLSSKGYTWLLAEPGSHTLKQKWPIDMVSFKPLEIQPNWVAGKKYYYRLSPTSSTRYDGLKHFIDFTWTLAQVDEAQALVELKSTAYQRPHDSN